MNRFTYSLFVVLILLACEAPQQKEVKPDPNRSNETIGDVIRMSPQLDEIIAEDATIEVLAKGFDWSEGPLWIEEGGYLLFSDVPRNTIYKWKEGEGESVYLKPSGYTGKVERGGEPGSNGLLLNSDGKLVLCQHGDRRIAVMDAELDQPEPIFATLVGSYEGKRFNSPNDAAFHPNGDLYFTDPPYGLEQKMNDSAKELNFQGVFRLDKEGSVQLITSELARPNGVAVLNDGEGILVANSDGAHPVIMKYDIRDNANSSSGEVFFDASTLKNQGLKGLPDGLKVSKKGNVFATGPGGVLVLDREGQHLGTISTGESISNCALDTEENYLYATSDMYLVRIKLKK